MARLLAGDRSHIRPRRQGDESRSGQTHR